MGLTIHLSIPLALERRLISDQREPTKLLLYR